MVLSSFMKFNARLVVCYPTLAVITEFLGLRFPVVGHVDAPAATFRGTNRRIPRGAEPESRILRSGRALRDPRRLNIPQTLAYFFFFFLLRATRGEGEGASLSTSAGKEAGFGISGEKNIEGNNLLVLILVKKI